jgi:hypothetical protein
MTSSIPFDLSVVDRSRWREGGCNGVAEFVVDIAREISLVSAVVHRVVDTVVDGDIILTEEFSTSFLLLRYDKGLFSFSESINNSYKLLKLFKNQECDYEKF